MSSTYAASFDRLDEGLDEIAAIDPTYRTTGAKQDALLGVSRLIARAEAERMRILATADDIAETTGDRSTAAWLADQTRDAHGTVRPPGARDRSRPAVGPGRRRLRCRHGESPRPE